MALSLYNAIYRKLVADPAVAALVGTRIWEGLSQDGEFPNIAVEVEEQEDDAITAKTAPHYDVTLTACALSPSTRSDVHDVVKACLNRQQWTDSNVAVVSTLITSEHRSADAELGNPEQTYHISEIMLSVIAEVGAVVDMTWPFDTSFDFAAGNLTGHDGWTTGAGVSAVVVVDEGIGAINGTAANQRTLAAGAPDATGPWVLHLECVLGAIDGSCEVALINSDAEEVASFSLQRTLDTNTLVWHVSHQGGGDGDGTATVGGSVFLVSLSLGANGAINFSINGGVLFVDTTVDGSVSLITKVTLSIVDASDGLTARISRLYFGEETPT